MTIHGRHLPQFMLDVLKAMPEVVVKAWTLFTPFIVAFAGYALKGLADGEAHQTPAAIAGILAGAFFIWALDLAYQRGRSRSDLKWARIMTAGVGELGRALSEGRVIEIVHVHRHEHYATPAAQEAMKADGWTITPKEESKA